MQFGGFISGRLGNWLPEPIPGSAWEFKTDQRGFGGGSFRVYGLIAFDTKDLGSITTGNSKGFVRSFVSIRCKPKPGGGYEYQRAQSKPLGGVGFKNTGPSETTWQISAQGNYPFAPRINLAIAALDFRVFIRVTCIAHPEYEVELSGGHDAFLDYEALWRDSGGKTQLYGYSSPAAGPTPMPISLGIGGNVTIKKTVRFDLGS